MTVCISIDSDIHTVLLSDCLVTGDAGHELMTPSSAGVTHRRNDMPRATLVSKFGRLDSDSIVGFAGPAERIQAFFEHFPSYYRIGLNDERPMRRASNLVNNFNEDAGSPQNEISMIGFHVRHVGQDTQQNWIRREQTAEVDAALGKCFAIGSGADALLREILQFDQNYWEEERGRGTDLRLACAVGALNTMMLLNPSAENLRSTWGGYYQINGYNRHTQQWFHSPDWLHMGAKIVLRDEGFSAGIADKFAFYRGGDSVSHLLVGAPFDDGGSVKHWIIRSGLGVDAAEGEENFVMQDFRPQFATIAFDIHCSERRWMRYTTLNGDLMDNLILRFEEGSRVSLGLKPEYFQFLADEEREHFRTITS